MEKLRLFTPLRKVKSFGSYEEVVDAFYKFDRGVNKTNMFGANIEYYKKIGLKNGHTGIDISCLDGTEVVASHDGWVKEEHDDEKDRNAGFGVVLVSNDPYEWPDGSIAYLKTIYWHNKENRVSQGESVKRGQTIALSDNTGFSTGPHLHFGLKKCDKQGNTQDWGNGYLGAVDPYPHIQYWEDDMPEPIIDEEMLNLLYEFGFNRKPDTEYWKDKSIKQFLKDAISQPEHKSLIRSFNVGRIVIKLFKKGGINL